MDDLDGLVQTTWGLGLPDLAKPAPADPFDQAVARDRLAIGIDLQGHVKIPGVPVRQTLPARNDTLQT